MSPQERQIGINNADPLLQAFGRDIWIAETASCTASTEGSRQQLSGQIWTPDMNNRQNGLWRPVVVTLNHYRRGGGYLSIEIPFSAGECPPEYTGFPEAINAGLQEYFRQEITPGNPELTYEIIPGISHEENEGLAVIFEPKMDSVEDQGATWSFILNFNGAFDPVQYGYTTLDDFAGAVIFRLASAVSPAVRYLHDRFPREYKKLVNKRNERTRTKPPSWILGYFQQQLQDAGGAWRLPSSGTEPDTYIAYGWLPVGEDDFLILAESHEAGGELRMISLHALSNYGSAEFETLDPEKKREIEQVVTGLGQELSRIKDKNGKALFQLFSYPRQGEQKDVTIGFLALPQAGENDRSLFGLRLAVYGIDLDGLADQGITKERIISAFLKRASYINKKVLEYLQANSDQYGQER